MTLKLIHVGLGGWGMDWETRAIHTIRKEVEVVGIVEAVEPILNAARKTLDLRKKQCFTTLEEALGSVEADGVLITAPVEAHVPLATMAMEAGLDVLSEKPLAPSVDEAIQGVKVAESTDRIFMISQNYRQYPAPRKAAELVANGKYGTLGSISIDFRRWANDAEAGTHRHYQVVHPLLYDMSIHHWDLMRMITGAEPVSVFVKQTDPEWSKFVQEASATAIVTFDNGVVVSYRGSWVSSDEPTHWAGDWKMETADGLIRWTSRAGDKHGTDGDAVTFRSRTSKARKLKLPEMPVWGRSRNLQLFAEAIRTREEPETSARRNVPSLALMVATAKSLESGQVEPVEIPEF